MKPRGRGMLARGRCVAAGAALALALGGVFAARANQPPAGPGAPSGAPAPVIDSNSAPPVNPPSPGGSTNTPAPPARPGGNAIDYGAIDIPNLVTRLGALDPARPLEYFELAEEVAAVSGRDARTLARRLYVLALTLDQPPRGDGALGSSACLGLAALTQRPGERRWLAATAAVIESDRAGPGAEPPEPTESPVVDEQTGLQLATAIALVRGGDGRRAQTLLNRPGVSRALDAYASVLDDRGSMGMAGQIRSWATSYLYCPRCRNKRMVTEPPRPGMPPETQVCPVCLGSPGPRLSEDQFLVQLAMESALVRGIHRLWSAQSMVDAGEPLRDPTPDELPAWYNVDATRPLFRHGEWVGSPDAATPARPTGPSPGAPPPG